MRLFNPDHQTVVHGRYSAGVGTDAGLLFISGQTPERDDGSVSRDPAEQLRQIWANIGSVLEAAGVGFDDLVQVRTYLASRDYRELNSQLRQETLGLHRPALTVVICELYETAWVAEIEVVAERRNADRRSGGL